MKRGWVAAAVYGLLALVATWPLGRGLARDVPWDLGDPVMVMWAIAWDCEQLLHILGGDLARLTTFFDANIFYPAPLTLAYSEHFIAQAVQVLPVYAITGNPILCYNLLFLSTFVLSGLGTYLFVRELTGNGRAAFVAGVLFAFAPYRIPQSSHLQVLSSQWMPFALYGFRRYFDTGSRRALAGATTAIVVEALSCGYYLLFWSPFAAAYAVWEMARRGELRRRDHWWRLATAGIVAIVILAPFLIPYQVVHDQLQLARGRGEVLRYSADVYSYLTAFEAQPLWGRVADAFHKPEGDLFPGLVAVVLAVIGLTNRTGFDFANREQSNPVRLSRRDWLAVALAGLAAIHAAATVWVMLARRVAIPLGPMTLRMSDATQLLLRALIPGGLALAASPRARQHTAAFMRSRGFFVVALIAAAWLSLGPSPQSLGRPLEMFGPYALLFDHVPGFDGVRVPARFGTIVVLMLAIVGGLGADLLTRHRRGVAVAAIITVLAMAESLALPFTVNGTTTVDGFATPEPRLHAGRGIPAVYREARRLPADAVIAELPLGQTDYDVRAMFYSTVHWRRLLNGYSGFFPRHYGSLAVAVSDVPHRRQLALDTLRTAGATHVLIHEAAFLGDQGPATSNAFRDAGARELFRDGGDVLLQLAQ